MGRGAGVGCAEGGEVGGGEAGRLVSLGGNDCFSKYAEDKKTQDSMVTEGTYRCRDRQETGTMECWICIGITDAKSWFGIYTDTDMHVDVCVRVCVHEMHPHTLPILATEKPWDRNTPILASNSHSP